MWAMKETLKRKDNLYILPFGEYSLQFTLDTCKNGFYTRPPEILQ